MSILRTNPTLYKIIKAGLWSWGGRGMLIWKLLKNYRRIHSSGAGIRLFVKIYETLTNGGFGGLQKFQAVSPSSLTGIRIIFDHNVGGGANQYSRDLINTIIAEGSSVLRIYYEDKAWFIEWIDANNGMIFIEKNTDALFESLTNVGVGDIIFNSPYAYPEIDRVIGHIVKLAKASKTEINYMVHDFYAICPSVHLIDYHGKYCFVPQDITICNACLLKNKYLHWGTNKPIKIIAWRQSFSELLEVASIVTVFDRSSIEILSRGFNFNRSKIQVVPHKQVSFKLEKAVGIGGPLHIGIFGTLSNFKGGEMVNKLAEFIWVNGLQISITLVGSSPLLTEPNLKVLGSYKREALPNIVVREGINVFLMASIVPETFSYTVSEAMEMGLPIVAFDIGAQGNRIKQYKFGKVVPLDSSLEAILEAIQSALKTAQG